MALDRPVEQLSDDELLEALGTSEDPAGRGFDEETQMRVLAHELVKARGRLAYYRTLYSTFVPEGKRYMIENLADSEEEAGGLPVKLAFTDDDDQARELEADDAVVVWTEQDLLDALRQELLLRDYFTDLLDEVKVG
ncbi:MAG: hypothetical protein M3Q65_21330 [Chloroflexota bacterium]|nr:hypothetical protein [Chloroflexota bacterium]